MLLADRPPVMNGRPEYRLFILGDSISLGYGPYLEQMLAGRFQCDRKGSELLSPDQREQNILQRLGALASSIPDLNGGDSAQVLDYLRKRGPLINADSTLLLLNCGLHDVRVDAGSGTYQVEAGDYARNLEEIIRLARAAARWVVWVNTTPVCDEHHNRLSPGYLRFNRDVNIYNDIAGEQMRAAGIPVIDLNRFTSSISTTGRLEDLLVDHVHFSEPVRKLQAAFLAGWIEAYCHD